MVCFKDDSVAAGWNVLEVSVKLVWRVIVSSLFFFFLIWMRKCFLSYFHFYKFLFIVVVVSF